MDFLLRAITDDEVPTFRSVLAMGFGGDAADEGEARFRDLMPLERTVAAFDAGQLVSTLGDFPLALTVPGGRQLRMAGTTMVAVRATHRRRGILRAMMRQHLDNAVERSEPIAGLWASEPDIYGRFGFGQAAESHEIKLDARRTTVAEADETVSFTMVSSDELSEVVAPFWRSQEMTRTGFIDREGARWDSIADDPASRREGKSALRHVVARRSGSVVGYLAYRQSGDWDDGVPNGTITVIDLVGADADAHRSLWHYATHIDLFPKVHFWNAPADDSVAVEASDPRAVRRLVTDTLYVRLLDLHAALTGRSYEADGEIVIDVADDMNYAAEKVTLRVRDGEATVTRSDLPPDVSLDVRELSALYLGRLCANSYASIGRIDGSTESIRLLGQMFGTARAPWCPEMF